MTCIRACSCAVAVRIYVLRSAFAFGRAFWRPAPSPSGAVSAARVSLSGARFAVCISPLALA
eukprot:9698747-Lingulodinium_polyedra.AAC.1